MKRIGYVSARDGGVDYHRLIRPLGALNGNGFEVVRYNAIPYDNVKDVDVSVVVFNRHLWGNEQSQVIAALKDKGIRVICDVDDYWVLNADHILYREHKKIAPEIIEAVKSADEVWCTHELLAERCRQLNSHVTIVPNGIAFEDEQWAYVPPPDTPETIIGYVGGNTHLPDIALTSDAWRKYPKLKPLLCGITKENADIFGAMGAIMSNRYSRHIDLMEGVGPHEYGTFYNNCHVAIAPLVDNAFNRCKSSLKILEAGAKGRMILAQGIHPYTSIRHEGVMHVTNWAEAFRQLSLMSRSEVVERGLSLREYIKEHFDLHRINEIRSRSLKMV